MSLSNMQLKKKLLLLIIGFMVVSSFVKALPQDDSVSTSSTNNLLRLSLYDASYNDFDDDGRMDDVECFLDIVISDDLNRKNFICDISIYLPNGDSYEYSILVSMKYDSITLRIVFMNHAYVSGDYRIKVEINLFTSGFYYDETDIVFDPPSEEIPDDEPFITYSTV
ncbi:MAG: hypothetical protein ACTSRR_01950 [Candidatus Heimdallarchaeaceae archaeon]